MPKVSIVKCEDYSSEVDSAVKKAVDFIGGMKKFVKKGDKVLIKPNLLMGAVPEKTVTTHPTVLAAVISLVKSAGGVPYVGDSPAFGDPVVVMKKAGLYDVIEQSGARIVKFEGKWQENPKGKIAKSFYLHKDLFEFDCIIDLPKLKTHSFTDYTGAVKNLFGLVVGMEKGKYHLKFQDKVVFYQMLLDLYGMVKPKLTIMDAVIGMEGNGPAGGEPRHAGLILASDDALSLDLAACRIIDMNETALHQAAEKAGLLPEVALIGEDIQKVLVRGWKKPSSYMRVPGLVSGILKKLFVEDPVVEKSMCTGCRTCFLVCPSVPKTITMKQGNKESKKKNPKDIYPDFNYDYCIHCYCCQESCPEKAIILKKRFF